MAHAFFVTVAKGLEECLKEELLEILKDRKPKWPEKPRETGGVSFEGEIEDAYRVILYSRVASRVYLRLHTFSAPTPERLYGGVKSIRWREHFTPNETIAIDFVTRQSAITHTQFGAQKTKDAIVDQFRSTTGERPSVRVDAPDIQIQVHLANDVATVNLDLSGKPLHERGYRKAFTEAPLKENLAAALLRLARWPEIAAQGGTLFDGMCGSGTFVIEGAWMLMNRAPGRFRERYGFDRWLQNPNGLWEKLKEEAIAAERPVDGRRVYACDIGARTLQQAKLNAEVAQVQDAIHFERRDFADWTAAPDKTGLVILNPPYGERLGDAQELVPLYRKVGDQLKKVFPGWKAGILVPEQILGKEVGLQASRRIPVWNGPIECRFQLYDLFTGSREPRKPRPEAGVETDAAPRVAESPRPVKPSPIKPVEEDRKPRRFIPKNQTKRDSDE